MTGATILGQSLINTAKDSTRSSTPETEQAITCVGTEQFTFLGSVAKLAQNATSAQNEEIVQLLY